MLDHPRADLTVNRARPEWEGIQISLDEPFFCFAQTPQLRQGDIQADRFPGEILEDLAGLAPNVEDQVSGMMV